jgi:hypothetical protein
MNYSQEQTTSYTEDSSHEKEPVSKKPNSKEMSNSQALEQLTGGVSKKDVDLTNASDGPSFANAAGVALDALLPGPGSSASMRVSGKLPIYTTGALSAYLLPAISLEAARLGTGKVKVTFASEIGLRAEAGTSGGWWPKFLAYFQGKVKGAIKITGDSAQEIFDEFLLTLRMVVEGACDSAGAPDSIKDAMANAIMTGQHKVETINNMDKGDSVEVVLGGEVEAGTDTSWGSAKAKAGLEFSKKLSKDENTDSLKVTETNKKNVTVETMVKIPKLGSSAKVGVNFIWKNGQFDEWNISVPITATMALGDFSEEILMGVDWIQDMINAISNAAAMAGGKTNNSSVRSAANALSGISVAENAIKYTAFGEGLKKASASSMFGSQSAQKIQFNISGKAGWSKSKGVNLNVALKSTSAWSLGKAGESPIQIDVKTGDTILNFSAGTAKGINLTSG